MLLKFILLFFGCWIDGKKHVLCLALAVYNQTYSIAGFEQSLCKFRYTTHDSQHKFTLNALLGCSGIDNYTPA